MKKGKMSTIRYTNNRRRNKIEWAETKAKLEAKLNIPLSPPRVRRKIDGIWIVIENNPD